MQNHRMISSKSTCSFQLFNKFVRSVSGKSLSTLKLANKLSKIGKPLKENALAKKKTKKSKKKISLTQRLKIESESNWLESLNATNLKLYRKTSVGAFRVIHTENLINKLKVIYPELTENDESKLKASSSPEPTRLENPNPPENPKDSNEPKCKFLFGNSLTFPLFHDTNENDVEEGPLKQDEFTKSMRFPSVTHILNKTMPATNRLKLEQWKEKMTNELGPEQFMNYKKNMLSTGCKLHGCLKQYMETKDESQILIHPTIEGCWNSVKPLLADFSEVKMVEEPVYHPILMYRGVVDCIASYKDVPCVIEWKRSEKEKRDLSSTFDAPLQLCAYLGAVCWHKKIPNLRNGLVVVVYTDGTPASVFPMDLPKCEHYWSEWLQRLNSYWSCNNPELTQSEVKV